MRQPVLEAELLGREALLMDPMLRDQIIAFLTQAAGVSVFRMMGLLSREFCRTIPPL
jgi:hypothetical protein